MSQEDSEHSSVQDTTRSFDIASSESSPDSGNYGSPSQHQEEAAEGDECDEEKTDCDQDVDEEEEDEEEEEDDEEDEYREFDPEEEEEEADGESEEDEEEVSEASAFKETVSG